MQLDVAGEEEVIDQGQQVACTPCESVELHHHNVPHFAALASLQQLAQGWPIERLARNPIIDEHVH